MVLKKGARIEARHNGGLCTFWQHRMNIRALVGAWADSLSPVNDGDVALKHQENLAWKVIMMANQAGWEEISNVQASKRRQEE